MAASKTDICNGALSLIGQPSITDFDTDTSEEGDQCRQHYERARKDMLAFIPWRFAQKTVALAADATKTNPLYLYSYPLPSDFLSLISSDRDEFEGALFVEGDRIVSDESSVTITYTSDFVDVGKFSDGFVRVLEEYLATRMVYALTKDRLLRREMIQSYEATLELEANRDAVQGTRNEKYLYDELVNIRL